VSDHLRDRLTVAVGEHFLIEDELGRGGMAAVFRALDVRLNRRVAIKLLPPDLAFNANVRSRFLREAQMAAALTHPNIVPIYTVDERDGLVYFVMAYVDGESVAALLARQGAFQVPQVRTIVAQVADALEYAHRQGVVHRDIKPDNILIDRSGRPMVTDFGIARAAAEESRLTVTGMAVGTPAYMSPEQAMGERDVDGRSDLYSLGIVAWQMLAGETPFKASNTPAMLMKHVSETPPSLHSRRRDLPDSLVAAIERCLAKRPEDRWGSAAELRDAALGLREVERPAAPLPVPLPAPSRPRYPEPLPPPEPVDIRDIRELNRHARRMQREMQAAPLTVEDRIASFRRKLASYVGTSLLLVGINLAVTPHFPWFIFPVIGMGIGLLSQLGSFWGDSIPMKRVFFWANRRGPAARDTALAGGEAPGRDVAALAPREVLEGSHGAAIHRAVANHRVVAELLAKVSKEERKMLPQDITETVDALLERVASVASTLHRLDTAANGTTLGSLDERIAELRSEASTGERERRLSLLERQRATLADLLERRSILLSQLESASLALENLKLDMVRFRSAGVSTALEDVTSATREARAVSREIGHLLEAADEVRKL